MRIGVIGAGAWGTALAQIAAADGEPWLIWARESEVANAINLAHENRVFLPGIPLSPSIQCDDRSRFSRYLRCLARGSTGPASGRRPRLDAGGIEAAGALRQGESRHRLAG